MLTLPGYTFLGVVYEDACIRVIHAYAEDALRVVAIKMVKEGPQQDVENAKLVHEYTLLSDLDMEHVLKPQRLEWQGGVRLLVHNIIQCVTMRHEIRRKGRTDEQTVAWAALLLSVVAELHDRGIVHMNIRPDTILLQPETFRVFLTGLSEAVRLEEGRVTLSPPMPPQGHPHYNAPERQSSTAVDCRQDLFSVGATLLEWFGGTLPATAKGIASLSEEVGLIVGKLLAERPEERYGSAREAAEAMRRLAAEESADESAFEAGPENGLLTSREREVLSLMAAGQSNQEIAQQLHVTYETVKAHAKNIYAKLGVNRRVQAANEAKRLKLLD